MSEQRRRRRPGSHWIRGVVACAAALALTGCSADPPTISSPDLSDADAAACRALVADLPDTLAGESSVEVTGDTAYGAAWGDPAIVLTCGVPALDLSDSPGCSVVDGIGWLVPHDETSGDVDATFTADGYRPRVQLFVPKDYLPEGGAAALADLAAPLEPHLKKVESCV